MDATSPFSVHPSGRLHLPLQQQPRRAADRQQQQQGSTDLQDRRNALQRLHAAQGGEEHPQRDTHGPSNTDGREHAGLQRCQAGGWVPAAAWGLQAQMG